MGQLIVPNHCYNLWYNKIIIIKYFSGYPIAVDFSDAASLIGTAFINNKSTIVLASMLNYYTFVDGWSLGMFFLFLATFLIVSKIATNCACLKGSFRRFLDSSIAGFKSIWEVKNTYNIIHVSKKRFQDFH